MRRRVPRSLVSRQAPPRRRWPRYLFLATAIPAVCLSAVLGYYYVGFARMIDARLHGERARALPRVFARPFELRQGQWLTVRQLVDRLNDLGYAQRARGEQPGEFAIGRGAIALVARGGDLAGRTLRIVFRKPAGSSGRVPGLQVRDEGDRVDRIEIVGAGDTDRVTFEAPLLTALITGGREKRRRVPLAVIPSRMVNAVLAIEDRRFFEHPGVDVIRAFGALLTNLRGDLPYLVGASTITQQLVKNFFLTPEKSIRRKLLEQFLALVLERRASKHEILELYLNEVYVGQRGSFAIHGVAEAARLFFAKDVTNISVSEAATIAGVIQSPPALSPFTNPERARERRNVVLRAMAESGSISDDAAERASREPLAVAARALETEAPYFVDYIGQIMADQYPALTVLSQAIDVHTTLDVYLQGLAQDAVREGLARVDELLARRGTRQPAQAALLAIDPRTGGILAMVGGRSYNQSQFNRALGARRQPGSVFKPFVYLAAFERGVAEGRVDLTPATLVTDEPTTFSYEQKAYIPGNYENEYDGLITLRRALAQSRNVATVKVAEMAGYDQVAVLWRRVGAGTPPRPYPSIALGVFEASPYEIATAYTIFANGGELRPLSAIERITNNGQDVPVAARLPARRIARADTTFLVTSMMRSVLNEGTGAAARAAGFALDAAGKSGTTNDLRDAWFVGFTPELLTVVWVGLDDNQPLRLSGTQAALPIWTTFMIRALAGHADIPLEAPEGIAVAEIDRDTGRLALPSCPRVFTEAFLEGTKPTEICDLHRFY